MSDSQFEQGERAGGVEARLVVLETGQDKLWNAMNEVRAGQIQTLLGIERLEQAARDRKSFDDSLREETKDLSHRVTALESTVTYQKGWLAGIIVFVTVIGTLATDWLKRKLFGA